MDKNLIPSPCFVLEEQKLVENLKLLERVQHESGVEIILALKGFAMWKVFPLVNQYLSGATASSLYEAKLVYEEMGVKPHVYCVVYEPNDFEEILKLSKKLSFNTIAQFEKYYPKVVRSGKNVTCGLRVNHEHSVVETDLYNPSSSNSRLGELVVNLPENLPEGIEGLHFHSLCESSSYDLEATLNAFQEKFGKYFSQLKWVNFGGGHLISRKNYDVEHLIKILSNFKKKFPGLAVILEPGSAIAWECGYLKTEVLDIHKGSSVNTLILNVSFTAHMPDTLEMPYRPVIRTAVEPQTGKYSYRIGGNSCLAGDFLEVYWFDEEVQIGDQLIFEDMIHYTMVKTSMFNGVNHPAIGVIKTDGSFELLRTFFYQDYKNRLS